MDVFKSIYRVFDYLLFFAKNAANPHLPIHIYLICVVVLACIIIVCISLKHSVLHSVSNAVFACALIIILCSTVVYRAPLGEYKLRIIPFQSYYDFFINGDVSIFFENIMNTFMMFPVGLTLTYSLQKYNHYTKLNVIIICIIPCIIELFQLIWQKGYFEIDDIVHNCIGGFIGIYICNLLVNKHMQKTS